MSSHSHIPAAIAAQLDEAHRRQVWTVIERFVVAHFSKRDQDLSASTKLNQAWLFWTTDVAGRPCDLPYTQGDLLHRAIMARRASAYIDLELRLQNLCENLWAQEIDLVFRTGVAIGDTDYLQLCQLSLADTRRRHLMERLLTCLSQHRYVEHGRQASHAEAVRWQPVPAAQTRMSVPYSAVKNSRVRCTHAKCEGQASLASQSSLQRHIREVHLVGCFKFTCPGSGLDQCPSEFVSNRRYIFKNHYQNEHSDKWNTLNKSQREALIDRAKRPLQ